MTDTPAWRPMRPADLDGVVRVARVSFPDHFEDRACFAERLALYPQGCFVLAAPTDIVGYLIAYPWTAASAPALNSLIHQLPTQPELIYLHDLALAPAMRGYGHTRTIMTRLVAGLRADGWSRIALVAVNDAAAFWQKMGFTSDRGPVRAASYGDGAAYMIRDI